MLFALIVFPCASILSTSSTDHRDGKKPFHRPHHRAVLRSREWLWEPQACTPHSASLQPDTTWQLGDINCGRVWGSPCTPQVADQSFPSLYMVLSLGIEMINTIVFIFPCDVLVILIRLVLWATSVTDPPHPHLSSSGEAAEEVCLTEEVCLRDWNSVFGAKKESQELCTIPFDLCNQLFSICKIFLKLI